MNFNMKRWKRIGYMPHKRSTTLIPHANDITLEDGTKWVYFAFNLWVQYFDKPKQEKLYTDNQMVNVIIAKFGVGFITGFCAAFILMSYIGIKL